MKKHRQKKIKKVSMTQEQAEIFYSESHIVEDLMKRRNENTSDFLDLKLKKYHFVFVYGTLKSGERNTFLLNDCPYLGEARTAAKGFYMKLSKMGGFPIIFEAKTKQEEKVCEYIKGEVYAVPPLKMLELDQLEANEVMYKRSQRWVWMDDQKIERKDKKNLKPAERCWIYIGNPLYWQGREMLDYPPLKYVDRTVYDFEGKTAEKMISDKVKRVNNEVFNSWAYQVPEHDDDFGNQALPF